MPLDLNHWKKGRKLNVKMLNNESIINAYMTPIGNEIGGYVVALATAVGVLLVDEKPSPYVYANGCLYIKRLHDQPVTFSDLRFPFGKRKDVVDLCHEIAHFQVCPHNRIRAPDFGLGKNDFSMKTGPLLVSQAWADEEEHRAMVLGFYHVAWLQKQLPRLIDGRLNDVGYRNWRAFRESSATRKVVRTFLEEKGLIRHGRPSIATVHGKRFV